MSSSDAQVKTAKYRTILSNKAGLTERQFDNEHDRQVTFEDMFHRASEALQLSLDPDVMGGAPPEVRCKPLTCAVPG